MKRPFLVTLSALVVLIFTCWNLLRAWTYLAWMDVLTEFSIRMAPGLGAGAAFFWSAAWGFILWGLWQKKAWTAKLLPVFAVTYTVWNWLERLVWANPQSNITFAIGMNTIWLTLLIFTSINLSREAYERINETSATE